jgi:hypothetical protein
MTMRIVVVIPQAPGLGVWVCTTHGEIASREIAGQLRLLELAGSQHLVPATIAIEWDRVRPRGRKPTSVPVVRLRFHQGLSDLLGAGRADAPELTA